MSIEAETAPSASPPESAAVSHQRTTPPDENAGPNETDERNPNPVTARARTQARRTGDGARLLGQWAGHWGSTADQSGEEIRRRIVAVQLEGHTERRDELAHAFAKATKKVVRLEEQAADGGLTQTQRSDLTLTRETARRLEKTLRDMTKVEFRARQPTGKQIARARSVGRLRRGTALLGAATATVLLVIHQPQVGLVGLLAGVGLAWWTGGHPPRLTHRPVPQDLLLPELDAPAELLTTEPLPTGADTDGDNQELFPGDTGKPFPIRTAADPTMAGACVLRALAAEGLAVGSVSGVTAERWGWRTVAHLTKGKPGDLVAKLANLDVLLGVRQGGVMAQPQKSAAGSVVLRVVTGDPFDPPPTHPVLAPRSRSIRQPMVLGPSMDSTPTEITLAGQNILVIAVPGGGKSAIIRNLVDHITACTDAIAWDIDPTGRGFGPLRRLAGRKAYTPKDIDRALNDAIRYAKARAQLMDDDVDNWQVSEASPAMFVFVDEHPQLTAKQKDKVIQLMRIGRKARITVVLASQDATADVVGDAVADVFGIRILLPSRKADVPLVVGSDTAISEGWMPHRLTPSPGEWDLADAGCFYILAPGLTDPILRKASFMTADVAKKRAEERLAAGLIALDPATIGTGSDEDGLPPILVAIRAAFERAADPEFLLTDQVLEHLATTDPAWCQWDDREPAYRRREGAKKITRDLKKAAIESLRTVRRTDLDKGNPPSGFWLADVEKTITDFLE
ncbi:hypothetical protein AB0K43_22110 [Kitasatospora sp. NPDC049258]|uniref:hypothetical protein n=1 Tax=Kitasatospora sp. NPDC049258 TaxID=3155394 RepID=UPI003417C1CA